MSRRSQQGLNRKKSELVENLHNSYKRHFANSDFKQALIVTKAVQKILANDSVVIDQAICLMRLGRFEEAYRLIKPRGPTTEEQRYSELMSELCGFLGYAAEVRQYGSRALALKDQVVAQETRYAVPAKNPPAFNKNAQNIIAFSLFGDNPRYCEVAIMNCHAAKRHMPAWKCRFYCDVSVPTAVLNRIIRMGGEIHMVSEEDHKEIHPLMWRFLVISDPQVERFLLRDADSLIGLRETKTIEEWVKSDKWFHLIRDYFSHSELLLAGLWGGCGGVIPNIREEIIRYLKRGDYASSHVDQYFLRYRIWPTVKQSVLSHDSQFDFFNNQPLPDVAASDTIQHIGANLSTGAIGGVVKTTSNTVIWTLLSERETVICSYQTPLVQGEWRSQIPDYYKEKIKAGLWHVVVNAQEALKLHENEL